MKLRTETIIRAIQAKHNFAWNNYAIGGKVVLGKALII